MGVWPNGYVITCNMFRRGRTFVGNKVCVFERDKMIAGQAARQLCTQTSSPSLVPADLEGSTLPPANSPNYLLSITSSALQFWRYNFSWAGGTCIPQAGTTRTLDSLADRLNYRLSYRNLGTRDALVINHAVTSGSVSAIRWYELANATGQTFASRSATTSPVPQSSRASATPTVDPTTRSEPWAMKPPSPSEPDRKPALSPAGATTSVDPVDGCTMVFTTELIPSDGSFNWTTYIYSFKLSTCQ